MVPVPAPVVATKVLPRAADHRDDGVYIRLGDLISALRLYNHFTVGTTP